MSAFRWARSRLDRHVSHRLTGRLLPSLRGRMAWTMAIRVEAGARNGSVTDLEWDVTATGEDEELKRLIEGILDDGLIPLDETDRLDPGQEFVFSREFVVNRPLGRDTLLAIELGVNLRGKNSEGGEVSASANVTVTEDDLAPVTEPCLPGPRTMCVLDDRFQVNVEWRDFDGDIGEGKVAAGQRFNDGGSFYFFNPNNRDLFVKLSNHCSDDDHFWVFVDGSTDVEYTVEVTDTSRGIEKSYFNPLGEPADFITDTSAFATCP